MGVWGCGDVGMWVRVGGVVLWTIRRNHDLETWSEKRLEARTAVARNLSTQLVTQIRSFSLRSHCTTHISQFHHTRRQQG